MTTIRLPQRILRALKEMAAREGKSLNSLLVEMAESALRKPVQRPGIPKTDPLWLIGTDPGHSDITDASERLDDYLYGPVTYDSTKAR